MEYIDNWTRSYSLVQCNHILNSSKIIFKGSVIKHILFPSVFFSVRLLLVLRGHSFFSFPLQRPMTSDFEGFLYQILSITLFSNLNSWERASIFPLQCWVLNKRTTGTIFITSLVWRGPWLGIEPGTSRIQSKHSTTRLSSWRWVKSWIFFSFDVNNQW